MIKRFLKTVLVIDELIVNSSVKAHPRTERVRND